MLTNRSNAETTFLFPSTAHFKMIPQRGILMAQQILPVIISFQPNQMGSFKSVADLNIQEGLSFVNIKLFGDSEFPDGPKILIGGKDKNFLDFERKLKFVDSIIIENEITDTGKVKELHEKDFKNSMTLMSLDNDAYYGTTKYRYFMICYLVFFYVLFNCSFLALLVIMNAINRCHETTKCTLLTSSYDFTQYYHIFLRLRTFHENSFYEFIKNSTILFINVCLLIIL
jgi:hypothetical protein